MGVGVGGQRRIVIQGTWLGAEDQVWEVCPRSNGLVPHHSMHHPMETLDALHHIHPQLVGHLTTYGPRVELAEGMPSTPTNEGVSIIILGAPPRSFFFGFGKGIIPCLRPRNPPSKRMTSPFFKSETCGPCSLRMRVSCSGRRMQVRQPNGTCPNRQSATRACTPRLHTWAETTHR